MVVILFWREIEKLGDRSSIQHVAQPDPSRNQLQPCLARPQWEGMVRERRGFVGGAARGGPRVGGLTTAHLRRGVGERGKRPVVDMVNHCGVFASLLELERSLIHRPI
jgi:hypothetical protein